jgi:hypothetical protein
MIAGLCTLSAVFGFMVGRHRSRSEYRTPISNETVVSEERRVEPPVTRSLPRPAPTVNALPPPQTMPTRHTIEEAHEVLSGIRAIVDQRSSPQDPLEASVNRMDDYLIGAVAAIRSTNPEVFSELSEQFTDDICSGRHSSDRDLMLFARLVLLQSDVGSVRALSCSLDGKRREDNLLWSLLRAWNSLGRPDLPDIRAIGAIATDERTKRLLLPPEESAERDREALRKSLAATRGSSNTAIPIGRARFE